MGVAGGQAEYHDKFDEILTDVVARTSTFLKVHSPRLSTSWNEFWRSFEPAVPSVRLVPVDAARFRYDLAYRRDRLAELDAAMVDGFQAVRAVARALFFKILPSPRFSSHFSGENAPVVAYKAGGSLATLQEFVQLDPGSVPATHVLVAKFGALLRLKGATDAQMAEGLTRSGLSCGPADVRAAMTPLVEAGLVEVARAPDGSESYSKLDKLQLPPEERRKFDRDLRPPIEWAVQLWRSLYNLRELNTPIDPGRGWATFLERTTSRAATQGFQAARFVVHNLVKYHDLLLGERT
ncbi:MAG: hypothetical protein Kow0069_35310 [Promethearchaeota archaeon]